MAKIFGISIIGIGAVLLVSCTKTPAPTADTSEPQAPATIATVWPSTLNVFGDGYPKPGDPCRRVGESAATVNFLDDSAILVGCPGTAAEAPAAAIISSGARVVGTEQNITLVSIPQGDANVGMAESGRAPSTKQEAPPNRPDGEDIE